MIEDPLIYLVVERIKQLSNSGMNLEETDFQLNLLDYILYNKEKSNRNNYDYHNYINQLANSYLYLDKEDYQMIGTEANVWFLKLIHDRITKEENDFMNSKNRLARLYLILEHPYCRYLIMMIYSNLSDGNSNHICTEFIEYIRGYSESSEEYIDKENHNILEEEIENILEDIKGE